MATRRLNTNGKEFYTKMGFSDDILQSLLDARSLP